MLSHLHRIPHAAAYICLQSRTLTCSACSSALNTGSVCKQMSSSTPQLHAAAASVVDRTGYQGFGSFHSEDVEVLVRQDSATYKVPALPFPDPLRAPTGADSAPAFASTGTSSSPASSGSSSNGSRSHASSCFGDAVKGQFLIDFRSWTFINHGAFGGVAGPAYRCAELWRRHCEQQPLRFIDR